jgi:hypothetical protein
MDMDGAILLESDGLQKRSFLGKMNEEILIEDK